MIMEGLAIDALGLFVGVEGADVEAGAGHLVGMEGGLGSEIVGEIAGGIAAAAVVQTVEDKGEILFHVDVERGHGPMALGLLGFFLHAEHLSVGIYLDNACALEFGNVGLVMAHDAGCGFLTGEIDEALERKVEEIVGGGDEDVLAV